MYLDEMFKAVDEAKGTLRYCDMIVSKIAHLIAGRLKTGKVPGPVLTMLKKELQQFDMRTGSWKDD